MMNTPKELKACAILVVMFVLSLFGSFSTLFVFQALFDIKVEENLGLTFAAFILLFAGYLGALQKSYEGIIKILSVVLICMSLGAQFGGEFRNDVGSWTALTAKVYSVGIGVYDHIPGTKLSTSVDIRIVLADIYRSERLFTAAEAELLRAIDLASGSPYIDPAVIVEAKVRLAAVYREQERFIDIGGVYGDVPHEHSVGLMPSRYLAFMMMFMIVTAFMVFFGRPRMSKFDLRRKQSSFVPT